MKTIKMRMLLLLGSLLIMVCVGLGIISYSTSAEALISNTEETMPKFALEGSKTIEAGILKHFNALEAIAAYDKINHFNSSDQNLSEATAILNTELKRAGHKRMALITDTGAAIYDDGSRADLKEIEYFKRALGGEKVVSNPMRYGEESEVVIIYAVPIQKENGKTVGVLMALRDGYELSELASQITYGKSGEAFIVNGLGNTIAHSNKEMLSEALSESQGSVDASSGATVVDAASGATVSKEEGKNLLGYENFSNLQQEMTRGNIGFGEYSFEGESKFMGFAPIGDLGWSIAVEINKDEVLSGLQSLKIKFIMMAIFSLMISLVIVYFIARSIDKPIAYLTKECHQMAAGDFTVVLDEKYKKRSDEIGALAKAFQMIADNVKKLLKENAMISNKVFVSSQDLNGMIEQSSKAVREVAETVEQIADGSHAQAQDTQFGVGKIDEMGQLIEQEQRYMQVLNKSADRVDQIKEEGFIILKGLIEKTEENNYITSEIYDVIINTNESANKIEQTSHMIGSIAKQTNLLALNAAIEAARAGEAGKGFSIVADEIRKLAEDADRFAKEITTIIGELNEKAAGSVDKMKEVSQIVASQTESVKLTEMQFEGIADAIENTRASIGVLSQSAREMKVKKEEVIGIIKNLSAVSEENASGTEEVTASIEEQTAYMEQISDLSQTLSYLAGKMDLSIDQFKY
ncbi:MAG: tlpB2 [Clostridia bacterium]|nr:tlpB2 [Clostridia bacterium]